VGGGLKSPGRYTFKRLIAGLVVFHGRLILRPGVQSLRTPLTFACVTLLVGAVLQLAAVLRWLHFNQAISG